MNRSQGFTTGEDVLRYCRDAFDRLYRSRREGHPRIMSIGLHARIIGRPGRIGALAGSIDHIQAHEGVWIAAREAIARRWRERFPAVADRSSLAHEQTLRGAVGQGRCVFRRHPAISFCHRKRPLLRVPAAPLWLPLASEEP